MTKLHLLVGSAGMVAICLAGSPSANRTGNDLFFDDFSSPQVDRSKWNVIVTGETVNQEQQAYVDSPETIAIVSGDAAAGATGGALALRAHYRPGFKTRDGRSFDFISGRLDTRSKVEFTYGSASARVKLTAGSGLWPAFWALGTGDWPNTGEMDIMENVGDPAWINFALHGPGYSANRALVSRHYFQGSDIAQWHVYALDWTSDALVFSVDGQPAYRVSRATVEQHGRWSFDTAKFLVVNQAVGGEYPRDVNHVSTPYNGVPQSTVDLVKTDKAVMLVDWVRVTAR